MNREQLQIAIEDICNVNPNAIKYSIQLKLALLAEQYAQSQTTELQKEIDRLKAENEELKKLYIELIELKGATEYPPLATIDLIRSFLNISERKGIDTNWDSYTMQCKRYIELYTLKPQINNESECLHPFDKIYQSTTECYCEQCGKDLTT